jgi:hypothetical protein
MLRKKRGWIQRLPINKVKAVIYIKDESVYNGLQQYKAKKAIS